MDAWGSEVQAKIITCILTAFTTKYKNKLCIRKRFPKKITVDVGMIQSVQKQGSTAKVGYTA